MKEALLSSKQQRIQIKLSDKATIAVVRHALIRPKPDVLIVDLENIRKALAFKLAIHVLLAHIQAAQVFIERKNIRIITDSSALT